MRLTIDNTGDHGKSVHPVTNNQCNVGNSNKAFEYMWSYHFSNPSDARQKENIRDIPDALDKVLALKGVKYDIKKEYSYNDLTIKDAKIKSGLEARRKNQVGFIAQDIYKVLPEAVVYDDSTDVYGIDYCKIVPVLVEAIKELKNQVDSLKLLSKKDPGSLKSAEIETGTGDAGTQPDKPYLGQNVPNPFSAATTISFYIPQSSQSAAVYIYNMQGLQIKAYNIVSKGNAAITIDGYELKPGMYLYTLVVDGNEIDTKKMLLTD